MSQDSRLRELERRFKESGLLADEAAYLRARIQSGMNGSGLDDVALSVYMNRMVEAGLTIQEAEKLFNSPSLPQRLLDVIREHEEPRRPPGGEYADEEVESNYGYPEGFRFRAPTEQIEVWRTHFPDLEASHVEVLAIGELPEGSESWAVIPKPSRIAGSYHEALEKMSSIIAEQRAFNDYRGARPLDPEHLRLIQDTQAWLDEMERDQPGDFMVFPFQFGLRHRGRSIRRARAVLSFNEVGLGPYEAAALLVTHPDRITTGDHQLRSVDCAGCEYARDPVGGFGSSLGFLWTHTMLSLYRYSSITHAYHDCGVASAFAP